MARVQHLTSPEMPIIGGTGAGLPDAPHALEADAVAHAFAVDPNRGLLQNQVVERLSSFGPNILMQHAKVSALQILFNQFMNPVVALLATAAILSIIFGQYPEAAAVVIVLLINGAIGFFTEIRAVRSMEALRGLSSFSVRVRRDGVPVVIPAEDIVPGDIVLLEGGDMVPADLRIIKTSNLAADESPLTGESLPVWKKEAPVEKDTPLADRTSMLFKGTSITRGTGEGLVTGTGMATELGRISRLVEQSEAERTPLERQLNRLSRDLIWLTLAITVAIAAAGILSGRDLFLMVTAAIALAVAAIPEGLPIVATLALARGMLRMARKNALIEHLNAVETLGATTAIFTDKTGTLTENRMHVARILCASGEIAVERETGTFRLGGRIVTAGEQPLLAETLQVLAFCNNATYSTDPNGSSGDPMEIALLEAVHFGGFEKAMLDNRFPRVREEAFDASTQMMATVHAGNGGFQVAVKGAPEAVFEHIGGVITQHGTEPFKQRVRARWFEKAEMLAGQGLRLLAIAGKEVERQDEPVYKGLTLLGLVGLHDPPRSDVASAIADTHAAGIKVIMVTGDHAVTASHISESIGLTPLSEQPMRGRNIPDPAETTPEERRRLLTTRIFSRVTPEQKLNLIALYQEAGDVVAMTGDGVNDAPALKKADIGIAMGLRGTQVARQAADMVLRDDAFSTIVAAVREGRVIYANIRRFTAYLLSCNLSEVLIVGLAVLAGLPLPLLPLQILFLNLVTDVFPAFALGAGEGEADVLKRPPRNPKEPILTRKNWLMIVGHGMLITAATLAALLIATRVMDLEGDEATTLSFLTLAFAQLFQVFNMRDPKASPFRNEITGNPYVWRALALCVFLLLAAAYIPQLAGPLAIVAPDAEGWAVVLLLSAAPLATVEFYRLAAGRMKS